MRLVPSADPGAPDLRSPERFVLWLARHQIPSLVGAASFGVLWMGSLATLPIALGDAVEAAARHQVAAVLLWGGAILGLGAFAAVTGIMRHRRAVANYLRSASRTQQVIIRCADRLGAELPLRVAAGEVASLSATDVDRIGEVFDNFGRFAGAVVSYLGVTVVLFVMDIPFGLVALVGGPLTVACLLGCLRPLTRRQQAQREAISVASGQAVDVVAGLRVLRGLGGEAMFVSRFALAADRIRQAMVRTAQMSAVLNALEALVPGTFLVAVTWIGALLAERGGAGPGELVTVYAFAAFLLVPLATFGESAQEFTQGRVSARRVLTVLRLERELAATEPGEGAALAPDRLAKGVLRDSQSGVEVRPGQLLAVTSARQEVLSALADRLGGYADALPDESVTLGEHRLSSLPLDLVRQTVMVVDRDSVLLAGSVRANLDAPPRRAQAGAPSLAQALRAAQADEIVSGLPGGLEHVLPERGRSLSGGQRQRLVLARALRAAPPILILDEPTSAVDTYTESLIVGALRRLRPGQTTVVLTTSPLLIESADEVQVLEERVVARGSHRELLASDGRYRELVARELG